jgi:hypothetical protein
MENIDNVNVSGFLELGKTVEVTESNPKGFIARIWERKLVRGAAIGIATIAILSPLEKDGFDYVTTRIGADIGLSAFSTVNGKAQNFIDQNEATAPARVQKAICDYAVSHHISANILEAVNLHCPTTIPTKLPGEVHG